MSTSDSIHLKPKIWAVFIVKRTSWNIFDIKKKGLHLSNNVVLYYIYVFLYIKIYRKRGDFCQINRQDIKTMRVGYNIESVEQHSVSIISENKITRFFDHTMEEESIDDEIVRNASKKKYLDQLDLDEI